MGDAESCKCAALKMPPCSFCEGESKVHANIGMATCSPATPENTIKVVPEKLCAYATPKKIEYVCLPRMMVDVDANDPEDFAKNDELDELVDACERRARGFIQRTYREWPTCSVGGRTVDLEMRPSEEGADADDLWEAVLVCLLCEEKRLHPPLAAVEAAQARVRARIGENVLSHEEVAEMMARSMVYGGAKPSDCLTATEIRAREEEMDRRLERMREERRTRRMSDAEARLWEMHRDSFRGR